MTDKYEAGRKKHMAWHKAQGDPWTWNVYEITTGPDTGGYIIVVAQPPVGRHRHLDGQVRRGRHGRRRRVDGRHAGLVAAVLLDAAELDQPPASGGRGAATPLASLTIYSVKPGHDAALIAAIGKLNAALTAGKYPLHSIWFRLSSGGATPGLRRGHATRQPGQLRRRGVAARSKSSWARPARTRWSRSSSTTSPASRPSSCSGARISATLQTNDCDCDCRLTMRGCATDAAICDRNLQSAIDLLAITPLIARAAQRAARASVGDCAVAYHRFAVDEDVLDADGVAVRILERRDVADRGRVEDGDVGKQTRRAGCRGPSARRARRGVTSSCGRPPPASAASPPARTCPGCARSVPHARGCDFESDSGPSSARAPESVSMETSGCASAVRTSASSMIEMIT